jgi:hypothetical protein
MRLLRSLGERKLKEVQSARDGARADAKACRDPLIFTYEQL